MLAGDNRRVCDQVIGSTSVEARRLSFFDSNSRLKKKKKGRSGLLVNGLVFVERIVEIGPKFGFCRRKNKIVLVVA